MINYTDELKKFTDTNVLLAQGKNNDVLILTKLEEPFKRMDKKRVSYEVNHRWLSTSCQRETDQAWTCVQGEENTFWSQKELIESNVLEKNGKLKKDIMLFDCFHIF